MIEKEFKQIYNLLEKSFEPFLYRSYEEQKSLLSNEKYHLIKYKENDELIGFLSYWEIEKDIYFAEHFAVLPERRGGGIGKNIFKKFIDLEGKKILEVEPPNTDYDKRRIKLYESFGFIFHKNEYYQPPYNKQDLKTRLHIMCNEKLDNQKFMEIVTSIYKTVYNVKFEDIFI